MAKFLYRLGSFAARRAWAVILVWLVVLGVSGGLAATGGATLSSNVTLDGTKAQQVIDDLKVSFTQASRGSGSAIIYKPGGEPFTPEEKRQVAEVLKRVTKLDGVSGTVNPFVTSASLASRQESIVSGQADLEQAKLDLAQAELDVADGWRKLAEGEAEIADAEAELASAQAEIDAGAAELATAQRELDSNRAQVEAGLAQAISAGAPAETIAGLQANLAQIEAGQQQLDAGKAELATGQARLNGGLRELEDGRAELDQARADLEQAELDIADGYLQIEENLPKLAAGQKLLDATGNFDTVSASGSAAIINVIFDTQMTAVEPTQKDAVVAELRALQSDSVQIEFSKELFFSLGSLLGIGEIVGLVIAAIVLFVMLGTFVGAGMPVMSAILGVAISGAITFALASVIEMTSTTPVLGVMLGLAVGIDYSLFLLNRHRRQLKMGMDLRESIAVATGTSGNAVLFAGLTVIIALAALNLTGIGFLGLMGTMGAMAIAISVLVAITFMPALMQLIGMRVLSKKERAAAIDPVLQHEAEAPKNATKPVFARKHPWITLVSTVMVLVIAAIPAQSLRLGLPDGSADATDSSSYRAFKLISAEFGEGSNGPVVVVAQVPAPLDEVAELELQAEVATQIKALPDVAAVLLGGTSEDSTKYLFQVIPTGGPTSETTEQLVYDLRELSDELAANSDVELGVTGLAASNIDVSQKLSEALPLYLGTVLVLSLLLLILVFRSILVPLVASLGFLLTVFATLGAVTAVYQWGWFGELFGVHDPGPVLSFLPTILIGILFGLAMDYQLFLASGIREAYVHGKSPREAIDYGIHLSRAVVIAAAIIMITVFGGFIFSHESMIRPMGFGLAIGVLLDAFLVRLLLVPAVLAVLGKSAWWIPKWLDRIMPDVDVEGAKLERAIR